MSLFCLISDDGTILAGNNYDKTVHVIFPAEVRYVDLGSPDLIAGKADGLTIIRKC